MIEFRPMNGSELIAHERQRQQTEEHKDAAGDDRNEMGELADAAIAYAWTASLQVCEVPTGFAVQEPRDRWPATWDPKSWKPSEDPVRNLVKAGALIAAEIDRIQRQREKA